MKSDVTRVKYFLNTLRPQFVKGSQTIIMWRFSQLCKSKRRPPEVVDQVPDPQKENRGRGCNTSLPRTIRGRKPQL
eukprot:4179480-Amphidinium_carterae.1